MWHRQEAGRGGADRRNCVRMEWALDWMSRVFPAYGRVWKLEGRTFRLESLILLVPTLSGETQGSTCTKGSHSSQLPLLEPTGKRDTLQNLLKPKGLDYQIRSIVIMADVRNGSQVNG